MNTLASSTSRAASVPCAIGVGTARRPGPATEELAHGQATRAALPSRIRDRLPFARRARGAAELRAFGAGYAAVSGYRVAEDYLEHADVFVVVREGRVAGGFVLNTNPPFRTQARLPEIDQARLAWAFSPDHTVEMTCVWLEPTARGPLGSSALWTTLVWRTGRLGANIVFGTEIDSLRRLYERTKPRLIYEGPVCVDGRQRHGWVYAISISRFPMLTMLRLNVGRWVR